MEGQTPITHYFTPPSVKRKGDDEIDDAEMTPATDVRNPRKTRKQENNARHLLNKQKHINFDQNRFVDLVDDDTGNPANNLVKSFPPITITKQLVNVKSTYSLFNN